MSELRDVEREFRDKVCGEIRLRPEGISRYRVFTPFRFDDGDRVSLVLRMEDNQWILSDEGSTYMRLSYRLDDRALQTEGRRTIIENAVDASGIQDRRGELVALVGDNGYGNALYSLILAVLRISDVSLLTREQVRSTFLQDVEHLIEGLVPAERRVRRWSEPRLDPDGRYPVDWYIKTDGTPLFVFALTSEDKVKDATITLHQFEKWKYDYRTLGIFQDQEDVSQRTLARFIDVAEKNFSALQGNEERVAQYIRKALPLGEPSPN